MRDTSRQDVATIARTYGVAQDRIDAAVAELRDGGLIANVESGAASDPQATLTDAGCDVLERLAAARRAHFEELSADWDPEHDRDMATYMRDVARELVPDVQRPTNRAIPRS